MPGLLPHLAVIARDLRLAAGLTLAHVAVHVHKRNSTTGVSESTVARFEHAQHWPEDPDEFVRAYALALGVEPHVLWERALARWRDRN